MRCCTRRLTVNNRCSNADSAHAGGVHGTGSGVQEGCGLQSCSSEVNPAGNDSPIDEIMTQNANAQSSAARLRFGSYLTGTVFAWSEIPALIRAVRSGTPRPAIAKLLCGSWPTKSQRVPATGKPSKLLSCMGFTNIVCHQEKLDSGHFLSAPQAQSGRCHVARRQGAGAGRAAHRGMMGSHARRRS